jgi:hypothetical protein
MNTYKLDDHKLDADVFNDHAKYTYLEFSDVPDPNDPTHKKKIPTVVINMWMAEAYIERCKNILRSTWPAFQVYFSGGGKGIKDKYTEQSASNTTTLGTIFTNDVNTMATDMYNIYINPIFLWQLAAYKGTMSDPDIDMLDPIITDAQGKPTGYTKNGKDSNKGQFMGVDDQTVYVLAHECYHCMRDHRSREKQFRRVYQHNVDHTRCNYVQDNEINVQLEAFMGFADMEDATGKQVGVTKLLGGIIYRGDDLAKDNWTRVSPELDKLLLDSPREFLRDDDHPEYGSYKIRFPKPLAMVWEDLYTYFDEHNCWPATPERESAYDPQNNNDINKQLGGDNEDNQDEEQPEVVGSQAVYYDGYYDGYHGLPPAKTTEDYQAGYVDGAKGKKYDTENNTCINDPDYLEALDSTDEE